MAIARILEPHVARVVIANGMAIKGIGDRRAKTDQLDARTLAQLLGSGFLPAVWPGDEVVRLARRRMSRRAQLVRERTRLKNQILDKTSVALQRSPSTGGRKHSC